MTTTKNAKSTSRRTRLTLAALALGTLATGAAVTTAGTAAADTQGTRITSTAPDVGVPAEGIAGPGTAVIAPDGTRITGLSSQPQGLAHAHKDAGRSAASPGGQMKAAASVNITFKVNGARLRASVPSGRVVALAYENTTAYAHCKIPGSDGYTWGWIDAYVGGGWHAGWARQDLWYPTQFTGPGGGGTGVVPWC